MERYIKHDMVGIINWLRDNELISNINKSKFVILRNKQVTQKNQRTKKQPQI